MVSRETSRCWSSHPCQTVSTTALLCLEVSHHDDKASSKKLKNSWLTPQSRNATAITSGEKARHATNPAQHPELYFFLNHLTPSASFLLIPLLLFLVVDCSLFCFVDIFHSWLSEDTVNMWGSPVLFFLPHSVSSTTPAILGPSLQTLIVLIGGVVTSNSLTDWGQTPNKLTCLSYRHVRIVLQTGGFQCISRISSTCDHHPNRR